MLCGVSSLTVLSDTIPHWIEKNLFRFYKMKIDKTNVKVPLTKAKLDLLLKRPMSNERLERIRNGFCFCALTGLAFTNVDHMRPEHITAPYGFINRGRRPQL